MRNIVGSLSLEKHGKAFAYKAFTEFSGGGFGKFGKFLCPALFYIGRHLEHICRRRALSYGIGKYVNVGKADFSGKFHRFPVILLGLAGKARHNIGGDTAIWECTAQFINKLAVHFGSITPVHCRKGLAAAALERKVKAGAEAFKGGKTGNVPVGYPLGFKRTEAHTLNTLHCTDCLHCVNQPKLPVVTVVPVVSAQIAAVKGKVYSRENYFFIALRSKFFRFGNYIFNGLGTNISSCFWDNAVCTSPGAAVLYFQKCSGVLPGAGIGETGGRSLL